MSILKALKLSFLTKIPDAEKIYTLMTIISFISISYR